MLDYSYDVNSQACPHSPGMPLLSEDEEEEGEEGKEGNEENVDMAEDMASEEGSHENGDTIVMVD